MNKNIKSIILLGSMVWFVAALFYSFEFLLRISVSLMVPDLMQSFAIDATVIGNISAIYYLSYQAMQIPAGMLLDRFGIKRLLGLAAFVVALGCFLFSIATHVWLIMFARLLIGLGSAFAFLACLKIAANWFPEKSFAFMVGFTNMLGVIGAGIAEMPLAGLIKTLGWRHSMLVASAVGLGLVLLMFLLVKDKPHSDVATDYKLTVKTNFRFGLKHLFLSPQTWLVALFAGLMVVPVAGFAELWSVPFLTLAHHISRTEAASINALIFIGIAVGGPVNGLLSSLLGKRKPILLLGNIGAVICTALIVYKMDLNLYVLGALMFLLGYFASTMLLAFAMNRALNPESVSGTVMGLTNMMTTIGGALFQPLIGRVLDLSWQGQMLHDARVYPISGYQSGFTTIIVALILALVIFYFIKEPKSKIG